MGASNNAAVRNRSAMNEDAVAFRSKVPHVRALSRPYVRETPILRTIGADVGLPAFPLTLKLELHQYSGSFKARGAVANLLLRDVPDAGVVAASGGNHGAAVAYAASRLGVPARIFVPTVCAEPKLARIREYGAALTITGDRYADALAESEQWASRHGAIAIHAFDQRETLFGPATLGAELEEQVPDAATILVSIGGGGLIGGLAAWYDGRARIIGVEPSLAPTMTAALAAGQPVDAPAGGVAVDSLAPRRAGHLTLPLVQAYVDRVLLVEDSDIVHAQNVLWNAFRIMAEPGGAAALAALLAGRYVPASDEHVVVVVCGGNAAR